MPLCVPVQVRYVSLKRDIKILVWVQQLKQEKNFLIATLRIIQKLKVNKQSDAFNVQYAWNAGLKGIKV